MKKPQIPILVVITMLLAVFTLGFFLGRNTGRSRVQLSVPAEMTAPRTETVHLPEEAATETAEAPVLFPIDLNTATQDELMALPGIGEVYARMILDYRANNGDFQAVEELLNIEGIGEKRLEAIYDLVTIGG